MRPCLRRTTAVLLLLTALSTTVRAQDYVVYDPWNLAQAVLQVYNLVRQWVETVRQAQRLPVDMATRYRGRDVNWVLQDLTSGMPDVRPLLSALNTGDLTGGAYRRLVDPLDLPADILNRMPPALRQRLTAAYAIIELADHVAARAIDQVGSSRAIGALTLQTIRNAEQDAASTSSAFATHTALLNKINGTGVVGLHLAGQTNQFLLNTLEQLIVDNTRKRSTEAALMDATIHHWRYGKAYGADLFRNTAANLDTYRLP